MKELLGFLERKATPANASESEMVRIKKVCLNSQSAGHTRLSNFALTGLLSLHANLLEERPRYSNFAATAYG